jgi:DNA-binding NarL/FixJ family response regulator
VEFVGCGNPSYDLDTTSVLLSNPFAYDISEPRMNASAATDVPLTLLLVEDLPVVRAGLAALLRRAFEAPRIMEADTVQLACAHIRRQAIDLAVVDIGLPDGSGLDVVRQLRSLQSNAICIMSTVYDDDAHVFPALEAGADGYLLKERPEAELLAALRNARSGIPALTPSIARKLMQHFRVPGNSAATAGAHAAARDSAPEFAERAAERGAPLPAGLHTDLPAGEVALTKREREVLAAVGLGKRVSLVAAELGISDNTVAGYIKEIYRKLHITSRAQAALEAHKRGLV